MSNAALSAVRTVVRRRLNEPVAGFWTNADLNAHIQTAYSKWFKRYLRKNPTLSSQTVDVTYTSGAESVAVTTTGYTIGAITLVEDRTDIQPGVPLEKLEHKWDVVAEGVDHDFPSDPEGTVCRWYFEKTSSTATGVITIAQTLYLSPNPTSARSLRIHYAAEPQSLAGDTYTTGLPDEYEECVVSEACVLAKLQEQVAPGVIQIYRDQLKEAEIAVRENIGRPTRGPGRIVYYDDTQ